MEYKSFASICKSFMYHLRALKETDLERRRYIIFHFQERWSLHPLFVSLPLLSLWGATVGLQIFATRLSYAWCALSSEVSASETKEMAAWEAALVTFPVSKRKLQKRNLCTVRRNVC